jgi:co-chaperonin GroES (HSP10)
MPNYLPFEPLGNRVVIKVIEEQADDNGIVVPKKYRQQSNKGRIVYSAVSSLKPGDIVLFGQYNAEKFTKGGEELEIVRIEDIRGVERLIEESNVQS